MYMIYSHFLTTDFFYNQLFGFPGYTVAMAIEYKIVCASFQVSQTDEQN
jgi:hypothetical protein